MKNYIYRHTLFMKEIDNALSMVIHTLEPLPDITMTFLTSASWTAKNKCEIELNFNNRQVQGVSVTALKIKEPGYYSSFFGAVVQAVHSEKVEV